MTIFEKDGVRACAVLDRFLETGRVGKTGDNGDCLLQLQEPDSDLMGLHHAMLGHMMDGCESAIRQVILSREIESMIPEVHTHPFADYRTRVTRLAKGLFRHEWDRINVNRALPDYLAEKFAEVSHVLHSSEGRKAVRLELFDMCPTSMTAVFCSKAVGNLERMSAGNRAIVDLCLKTAKAHEDMQDKVPDVLSGYKAAETINKIHDVLKQRLVWMRGLNGLMAEGMSLHRQSMPTMSF